MTLALLVLAENLAFFVSVNPLDMAGFLLTIFQIEVVVVIAFDLCKLLRKFLS